MILPFLDYLRYQKNYSEHSIISYRTDLEQFEVWLKACYEIESISEAKRIHIRDWLADLTMHGMNASTIKRKLSALNSFYKFLIREGILSSNPGKNIQTPKQKSRLPAFVPETELNLMFDGLIETDDYASRLNRMIIHLIYQTGIRLSECIGLRIENLDLQRGTIKVFGKRRKERIIPITAELTHELESFIEFRKQSGVESPWVICMEHGEAVYPMYVYRLVRQCLQQTSASRKSPHILRHSIATHLLHHGADLNAIKELLGHSRLTATQVYTHNNIAELVRTYKKAHPKP